LNYYNILTFTILSTLLGTFIIFYIFIISVSSRKSENDIISPNDISVTISENSSMLIKYK